MLDLTKSLIIFSHPRSGSTWFQAGLKHYNTLELFNLSLLYHTTPYREEMKNSIGEYYKLSYPKHRYDEADVKNELNDRFKIFNELETIHKPISVKIHTNDMNDKIVNFLSTKELDYVLIERRDKISTFWSFIVSWTTLQFHFFDPKFQEITITKETFNQVSKMMLSFNDQVIELKKTFPIHHLYYEDILDLEISDWWIRPNNRIKIQNAAKITTIVNREELMSWIEEIDLFNRI